MTDSRPRVRPYPRNSAEAAARLVALALIANGRIKAVETAALEALEAPRQLGLTRPQWHAALIDLCADLLGGDRRGAAVSITSELLDGMLDEIDDHALRRVVLRLASAVVHADREIDEGESFVLLGAIERWGPDAGEHALLEPLLYGADFQVRPRGQLPGSVRTVRLR